MVDTNTSAPAPVATNNNNDALKAELERLKAENEGLRSAAVANKSNRKFGIEVGDKGGVVIKLPGQRFPLSPYAPDLCTLLENAAEIAAFMKANASKLKFAGPNDVPAVHDTIKKTTMGRIEALLKKLS